MTCGCKSFVDRIFLAKYISCECSNLNLSSGNVVNLKYSISVKFACVKNELQKWDETRRAVAHGNVALRTFFDRVIHGRSGNNGAQGDLAGVQVP